MELSHISELKDSMKSVGQLSPIILDENAYILSGHRRFKAASILGWNTLRCDIVTGLSEFDKKAIIISSNTTQQRLNTWESRQFIQNLYWNEFLEEYESKSINDNGYSTFAKKLGIGLATIKKILDASKPENKKLVTELKEQKIDIDVIDLIVAAPVEKRQYLKTLATTRYKHHGTNSKARTRDLLRAASRQLHIKQHGGINKATFNRLCYKVEIALADLSEDLLNTCDKDQVQRVRDIIKPVAKLWLNMG